MPSGSIEISEERGVRYLHVGSPWVQSAMRLSRPDSLELEYTRHMMAFLLFRPEPLEVLLIGLGGGSLAKFIYRNFPETRITAVEIDPKIVQVARSMFALPDDVRRLRVVTGDGAEFVRETKRRFDAILVDGYSHDNIPAELSSESFYADCRGRLKESGVLVANLFGNIRKFNANMKPLLSAFEDRVLVLPPSDRGNVIAFAFTGSPVRLEKAALLDDAKAMHAALGLRFPDWVRGFWQVNGLAGAGDSI